MYVIPTCLLLRIVKGFIEFTTATTSEAPPFWPRGLRIRHRTPIATRHYLWQGGHVGGLPRGVYGWMVSGSEVANPPGYLT